MTVKPQRLYFDNAATSFPKPPEVARAMARYMNEVGASPGRGAYAEAIEAGRILMRCRELINRLIHGESPSHVVFTLNASDALNLAIKGITHHHRRRGEPVHIVTTQMDHNSILRPLREVERAPDGAQVTRVEVDAETGRVKPEDIRAAIRPDTRLIAMIHGSNVTGAIQPIEEIGAICREHHVPFLVDAAQTLGHMPVDVQRMHIDLLAFPGHKGLLGPLGTGGLYLRPGMERLVDTLREGGTGSASERDVQPQHMPDKYEPGSHNAPGIAGLAAGVAWILDRGVDELWSHEQRLMRIMLDGLRDVPGLRLLGPTSTEHRCGVFSIAMEGFEPADVAAILEEHYGILARPGLHCAPLAHAALGTASGGGAVRLSLGPFLTEDDVRYAVASIGEICRESAPMRQPMTASPSAQPTARASVT
jgi:cysteine desulfurase/selenocysteine lyase